MKYPGPHFQDMLDYSAEMQTLAQSDRADLRTLRAIERDLAVIGEAANCSTPDFRNKHPHIPWRKIIDLRNIIVHGYDRISADALWEIVDDHLPPLQDQLDEVIKEPPND